jgi:hypothetical protein
VQPGAQLVRVQVRLGGAAAAGHDDTGRGDAGQAGEAEVLERWALQRPGSLRAVTGSTLALDDACAMASTGDVWLFRGRSFADHAIRAVTNSPVNHVGMVVALDDLPPLLWHAELGRSLRDVWTGEFQRGVQLHVLRDAVLTWSSKYHQRAWIRQLEGTVTREHEDRLMEVVERFDGKPFPTTPGLAAQWAAGRVRRRETSRETIYCAELVATTYQHMGLLPKRRPASWYDPGKFWSGDRVALEPPFALGGEIAITPEPL